MTTKVKNKKDNKEIEKKDIKQIDEIDEQLKKKDYILTVHQTGDEMMSLGELENQICMRGVLNKLLRLFQRSFGI